MLANGKSDRTHLVVSYGRPVAECDTIEFRRRMHTTALRRDSRNGGCGHVFAGAFVRPCSKPKFCDGGNSRRRRAHNSVVTAGIP